MLDSSPSEVATTVGSHEVIERAYDVFEEFAWATLNTWNLADSTTLGLRSLQGQNRLGADQVRGTPAAPRNRGDLHIDIEVAQDFRFTWGQATIAMWGHLEAYIEDFCTLIIKEEPKRIEEALEKAKVRIVDYLTAEASERPRVLFRYLADERDGPKGETKFDRMLRRLRILDDTPLGPLGKDINEWNLVRNALVHRKGTADERFVKEYPQIAVAVGTPVRVNADRAFAFARSGIRYGARICDCYIRPLGPAELLDALKSWMDV
jgi:hypothetical protein